MRESMQTQGQPGECIKALSLKKKTKPTSPSTTTKPEEIRKQVSSAMCSWGLVIYRKSQRGAGRSSDRFSVGPYLLGNASKRPVVGNFAVLAFYLLISVNLSSVTETTKNQLHGAAFQSRSGRRRPGGLGSTQLIQKLAQLAWYWCPP